MDGLEKNMEECGPLYRMAAACLQPRQQRAHFVGHRQRIWRDMGGTDYFDLNAAIGPAIHRAVRQHKRMKFADEPFIKVGTVGDAIAKIAECVTVANGLQMVLQRFLGMDRAKALFAKAIAAAKAKRTPAPKRSKTIPPTRAKKTVTTWFIEMPEESVAVSSS